MARVTPPSPEQLALAELLSDGNSYPVVRGERLQRLHLPVTLWISDTPEEPDEPAHDYTDAQTLEVEYTPYDVVKNRDFLRLLGKVAGLGNDTRVQLLILKDQGNQGYLKNLSAAEEQARRAARAHLESQ